MNSLEQGGVNDKNFHCKYIGLTIQNGAGQFERISTDAPLWGQQCEDPSHIWQDHRGNYHMLMHFFGREDNDKGMNPGGHAFSKQQPVCPSRALDRVVCTIIIATTAQLPLT